MYCWLLWPSFTGIRHETLYNSRCSRRNYSLFSLLTLTCRALRTHRVVLFLISPCVPGPVLLRGWSHPVHPVRVVLLQPLLRLEVQHQPRQPRTDQGCSGPHPRNRLDRRRLLHIQDRIRRTSTLHTAVQRFLKRSEDKVTIALFKKLLKSEVIDFRL